jgi:hypothetical protein
LLAALIGFPGALSAQDISTAVYPSEDEILRAFEQGRLDIERARRLQELVQYGMSAGTLFLLDEIPNLIYVPSEDRPLQSDLQAEQQSAFVGRATTVRRARIIYRVSNELEDDTRSRYRLSVRLKPGRPWDALARIHKEYSGRERLTERRIRYTSATGLLRTAIIGNYATRFGLGLVTGYRGKLVGFDRTLSSESLLYPDFGGFNGALVELGWSEVSLSTAVTAVRDSAIGISGAAACLAKSAGALRPSIQTAAVRVYNRRNGAESKLAYVSLAARNTYHRNHWAAELAVQFGDDRSGAFVAEGRHRFEEAELRFAGWIYGDRYRTFLTGSKSSSLSRTVEDEALGLKYRESRTGQAGAYFRTISDVGPRWRLIGSALFAGFDRDTTLVQALAGVESRVSQTLTVRGDILLKERRKSGSSEHYRLSRQCRLESRAQLPNFKVRSYIGYTDDTNEENYWSWFARGTYRFGSGMNLSAWLNVSRIRSGQCEYWYAFLRQQQALSDSFSAAARVSHRFNRSANEKHLTMVTVEVISNL